MPRNGTGTFTLVSGNPVVSGTTIESNWANTTLSDIATTLTDSLSRSGQGGMTAALRIADGTQGAPGVGFANETGSGFYRAGTGEVWAVVQGAQTLNLDANGVYVPADKTTTVDGAFVFNEAGADKDARFEGDTDANLLFTDASTDRVGIGTATPASKLDVVGDVTVSGAVNAGSVNATTLDLTNIEVTNIKAKDGTASASIADTTGVMSLVANPVLSGGTANGVLYLNGSKVATSGSALTFDGLNALALGSGGSTNTATSITLNATDNAANGGYILGKRNGTNAWLIGDAASGLGSGTGFLSYNYGTAPWIWFLQTGGEQMRLTSTGLGIGTSSPGAKLDVQGALGSLLGQFFETSSGQNRRIRFSISSNVSTIESTATTGSTNLAFAVDGFERMRLDSSGNVGIGTSSPGAKLDVYGGAAGTVTNVQVGNASTAFVLGVDSGNSCQIRTAQNVPILFYTNATERARINSGGDLLVGVTSGTRHWLSKSNAADYAVTLNNSNANPIGVQIYHNTDSNGAGNQFLDCQGAGNVRAQIRSNGGLANYSANDVNLSDRREKTNFAPAKSYLDTICAIPVQTFNYIDQSEDDPGLTLGVVAQDVQAVAPELVMESNWGTADNPKMRLSIYQTDLQYALMKCVQELKTQNDELRARVAALEAQP